MNQLRVCVFIKKKTIILTSMSDWIEDIEAAKIVKKCGSAHEESMADALGQLEGVLRDWCSSMTNIFK